jgi:hypothetical protein
MGPQIDEPLSSGRSSAETAASLILVQKIDWSQTIWCCIM